MDYFDTLRKIAPFLKNNAYKVFDIRSASWPRNWFVWTGMA